MFKISYLLHFEIMKRTNDNEWREVERNPPEMHAKLVNEKFIEEDFMERLIHVSSPPKEKGHCVADDFRRY